MKLSRFEHMWEKADHVINMLEWNRENVDIKVFGEHGEPHKIVIRDIQTTLSVEIAA